MAGKAKILLVDDDADFVKSNTDLLEAHGYEVVSAPDGKAGLEMALQEHPDLMVLDVMMATQTEGFEVARKIPETPELRRMPVLLVTGIRNAMRLGFRLEPDETWLPVHRVMEKPIDPAQFVATVKDLLRHRQGMDWKFGADRTVRRLLAAKKDAALHTLGPDATVLEAVQMMDKYSIGVVLVTDGDKLVGVCSERDCAKKVVLEGRSSKSTPVRDIMTSRVVCVTPDQTVEECMVLMTHKRIRHLPVMDGGALIGIISIGDLVRAAIAEKDLLIKQFENYISAG